MKENHLYLITICVVGIVALFLTLSSSFSPSGTDLVGQGLTPAERIVDIQYEVVREFDYESGSSFTNVYCPQGKYVLGGFCSATQVTSFYASDHGGDGYYDLWTCVVEPGGSLPVVAGVICGKVK
ncbi:hypothetical protein JW968_02180 [Candidatus Woesearchaeota archaeon]|nr:hypothetical protein [Candidatus Woesearchaeota archaeon]